MKTKLTPLNESTGQAPSVTSYHANGRWRDVRHRKETRTTSPALMRERQRRKKALVQVRALESLVKSYQEEEARLTRAYGDLQLRNEALAAQAEKLARKLEFFARVKVHQNGPKRLVEISPLVRIDPRQIEEGSRAHLLNIAEEIMQLLRVQMTEQMMTALVQSPLTLRSHPNAGRLYAQIKSRWMHEKLMDPRFRELVWGMIGGPEKLGEFWDTVAAAVIECAKQVPPGTDLRWVRGIEN